ncbi:unnamed protein product [Penicillium viridicatum]
MVEITKKHNEIVSVKTVLGPLAQADVPILRCVGLNYVKHGVGAGLSLPKYLVPGTQMDVVIDDIGTLRNGVVFDGNGLYDW